MSAPLRWKLIGGFVLVFIAGLVAGGYLEALHARHRVPPPRRHTLAERVHNRLQTRLGLTPEQIKKTAPIIDRTVRQLDAIRTETSQRVHDTLLAADRELSPDLTAEQRATLKEMEAQRDQNRDRELRRERLAEPTP